MVIDLCDLSVDINSGRITKALALFCWLFFWGFFSGGLRILT